MWHRSVAIVLFVVYAVYIPRAHGFSNCTLEHRTGNIVFPFFQCPDDTHCVVSGTGGDSYLSSAALNSFIPVGCCPDHLVVPCVDNSTTYSNLLGCCPQNTICCIGEMTGHPYMMGCATKATQCCSTRICEEGYSCCRTARGSTCCPDTTICASEDKYISVVPNNNNVRTARISSFFNISLGQLCIPADFQPEDDAPAEYPYTVVRYQPPQPFEDFEAFYVTDIARTPNVTECGSRMCYDSDVCIHRYRNVSKTRVFRNLTNVDCANAKMNNDSDWDRGCFSTGTIIEESSFPVGCCAADKTPCGAHSHTFQPYDVNAHSSPFLYDEIMGCVGENETCCHPYICPAEAQCCTGKRQVYGTDINITRFRESVGNGTFVTDNSGHNFCCPAEAFCCEYIPKHAKDRTMNTQPVSVPFCGVDASCTRNFFGTHRTLYPSRAVRETIPWTNTFFEDSLAFRQMNGVVGSTAPIDVSNTCFYTAIIGSDSTPIYFDIPCGVLNRGEVLSPADAILAPNVAPYTQIQRELELNGKIPCPSPTPEVWCDTGV